MRTENVSPKKRVKSKTKKDRLTKQPVLHETNTIEYKENNNHTSKKNIKTLSGNK